jgi:hypothetical protein
MVSKTPGKTRCINHFLINGAWWLVDLPGYGYARTSKGNVVEWNRFTREYFTERETLVTVLLLVDASIPPMALDLACAAWFAEAEVGLQWCSLVVVWLGPWSPFPPVLRNVEELRPACQLASLCCPCSLLLPLATLHMVQCRRLMLGA